MTNRKALKTGWYFEGGFGMKAVWGFLIIAAVCIMSLAVPSLAQSDEYVIVANKQLQGTSINKANLKGIYLREIKSWGNGGGEIVPVDFSTEDRFYQNLFQKNYTQMQAYWLNMRIKYSVSLPVSKKDAESVKEFIASNKDAIGFIRSGDLDDRVKVLKLVN
jgi:ABC-type phosphate transport system substrate-binding protein